MEYARAAGVIADVLDARAVLVDPQHRELLTLDPVGTLVWHALDQPGTPHDVAARILDDVEGVTLDVLTADVAVFLDELTDAGVVEAIPDR